MHPAAAARAAGVVDAASGAPRPLDQRILHAAERRVRVVIASAVDGEPDVATARRLAAERAEELVRGLEVIRAATGAARAFVAVEERAGEAARAVEQVGGRVERVPDLAGEPTLAAGAGVDPDDHGVLVVDAAAAVDLASGSPVVARAVSVSGGVARPGVYTLPLGTSVEDAVAAAGGATSGPAWIALAGGPRIGRPIDRDEPVTKGMRALFVVDAHSELARRARATPADRERRARSAWEHDALAHGPTTPSIDLAARHLGLGERAFAPPWNPAPIAPREVAIPLKQSLGVPARACVVAGDRVARGQPIALVPDGALGVAMHASIEGEIVEIGDAIVIRAPTAPRR